MESFKFLIIALSHSVFYLDRHCRISLYLGLSVLWVCIFDENVYGEVFSIISSSEIYDDWLSVSIAGDEIKFSPFRSTEDKNCSSLYKISFTLEYSRPMNPKYSGAWPDNLFEQKSLTRGGGGVSFSYESGAVWLGNSSDIIVSWRGGSWDTFLFDVIHSCLILRIISLFTSWGCRPNWSSGVNQFSRILGIG